MIEYKDKKADWTDEQWAEYWEHYWRRQEDSRRSEFHWRAERESSPIIVPSGVVHGCRPSVHFSERELATVNRIELLMPNLLTGAGDPLNSEERQFAKLLNQGDVCALREFVRKI